MTHISDIVSLSATALQQGSYVSARLYDGVAYTIGMTLREKPGTEYAPRSRCQDGRCSGSCSQLAQIGAARQLVVYISCTDEFELRSAGADSGSHELDQLHLSARPSGPDHVRSRLLLGRPPVELSSVVTDQAAGISS